MKKLLFILPVTISSAMIPVALEAAPMRAMDSIAVKECSNAALAQQIATAIFNSLTAQASGNRAARATLTYATIGLNTQVPGKIGTPMVQVFIRVTVGAVTKTYNFYFDYCDDIQALVGLVNAELDKLYAAAGWNAKRTGHVSYRNGI